MMVPPRSDFYYGPAKPYKYQVCTMLMDTQRERDIDLGNRYKFRPLRRSECFINY